MPARDVIVIGASAGGVEALQQLVSELPEHLPAAVLVAMHVGAGSELPRVLERKARLPVVRAEPGLPLEPCKVYVAPPDFHMTVHEGHIHLDHGPKENWHRPAINPLFRSAAAAYDGRVIGVILTGQLDDGVAGLWQIKKSGGVTVAQDPDDAAFPGMPASAIANVEVDHVVKVQQLADLLTKLVDEPVARGADPGPKTEAKEDMERTLTDLGCPACRGPIWELRTGNIIEFRCRVGHAYSPENFEFEQENSTENALWSAVVALEERSDLARRRAERSEPDAAQSWLREAERKRKYAQIIRDMLGEA